MWMGKQLAAQRRGGETAAVGTVSVGGEAPAVVTDGERRQVRIFSPGGYGWRPSAEDEVLLVGTGQPCIAGRAQSCPVSLAAGEVCLHTTGATVHLRNNGDIAVSGTLRLTGDVHISGRLFVGGQEIKGGL